MRRVLEGISIRFLDDMRAPRIVIPVAVLALAIVAVLALLPSSGTADQNELSPTTSSGAAVASSQVQLIPVVDHAPSIGVPVPYGTADPFRPAPTAKPKTTAATSGSTQSATAGESSSSSGTASGGNSAAGTTSGATKGGTGTAKTTQPTSTTPATTTPNFTFTKHATVNLGFGISGQPVQFLDNVRGNSPFPSSTNVAVMFVGVLVDTKTAVFLPSKGALATGPGKCLPSRTNCEYFELQPGQREHVLAQHNGGGSTLYGVSYVSLGKTS